MQPLGGPTDLWRAQPELPDDLRVGGLLAVEEVVVVALEHEPAVLHADDPVQDVRPELRSLVQHDVTRPVRALLPDDGEVAAMQHRLHRGSDDHRVRGRAAELRRAEEQPAGRDDEQAERAGENPNEASPFHVSQQDTAGRSMFLLRPAVRTRMLRRWRSRTAGQPS